MMKHEKRVLMDFCQIFALHFFFLPREIFNGGLRPETEERITFTHLMGTCLFAKREGKWDKKWVSLRWAKEREINRQRKRRKDKEREREREKEREWEREREKKESEKEREKKKERERERDRKSEWEKEREYLSQRNRRWF